MEKRTVVGVMGVITAIFLAIIGLVVYPGVNGEPKELQLLHVVL